MKQMLNDNILCEEIVEENVTKTGIYVPNVKRNYKKFKVLKSDSEGIKDGDIVYTPPHGMIEYEGKAIIKRPLIIMID